MDYYSFDRLQLIKGEQIDIFNRPPILFSHGGVVGRTSTLLSLPRDGVLSLPIGARNGRNSGAKKNFGRMIEICPVLSLY
jgi:hypothetical protein